jgi:hypothetical protein
MLLMSNIERNNNTGWWDNKRELSGRLTLSPLFKIQSSV